MTDSKVVCLLRERGERGERGERFCEINEQNLEKKTSGGGCANEWLDAKRNNLAKKVKTS